ncbi:MAG TPA: hypothetical protein VKS79_20430 [Gemmataceae bacterium]|nr:hypothetical protein [Gemmataceae bacterium]
MEKHFVLVDIDVVKNAGGQEIFEKYGPPRGVPAWTILNADQKVLADSMRDQKNVGFPYEPHEIAHFFDALKKSCPGLSEEELKILKDRLEEHCKARRAELEARKKDTGPR